MTTRMVECKWVIEACEKGLINAEKFYTRQMETLIQEARAPHRVWFRWKHRTRSEAISWLNENSFSFELAEHRLKRLKREFNEIRRLSLLPGKEFVSLDCETADTLIQWSNWSD